MNLRQRMDKEPIELLLGLAGAVQYLEHAHKDDETYWVRIKTKTGDKQITVPVVAVQQIQFQKPTPAVIESIRRQLTDSFSSDGSNSYTPIEATTKSKSVFWRRFLALFK